VTLLVGGVCTLLCVVLAFFSMDLAAAASDRARAQTAADAAALAAVAESAPYGSSDPRSVAMEFARLNDADLVRCLCEPGATAVQVTVSVEDVIAHARAVFDPESMGPGPVPGSFAGLHPVLAAAVKELLARAEGRVTLVSGYRSPARQSALWSQALDRYGDPETADDWVARPGSSMHERGLAVDLGGDVALASSLVEQLDLPLARPLLNEPWHFELRM
jgi:zinc D-Ala-D-Ala carboxypeptidase